MRPSGTATSWSKMSSRLTNTSDASIVAALQADARQTNRALATKAGLAPSTTLNRVRDLENRGVIRGYHADIDLAALGRDLQALVFVRLQPKNDETVTRFVDHIWAMPETIAIHLISGTEDIVVHLAVADTEALQRAVLNQISNFPGVVDERTSLVFQHRQKPVVDPL
jgi:DNA-binding Lrp family transcriptional regulator